MARITAQDCLEQMDNRFELVLASAQRARQLAMGAEPRVARENDKPTVIALREIADGAIGREVLDQESVTQPHEGLAEQPAGETPEPGEAIDASEATEAEEEASEEAEDTAGEQDAPSDEAES